MNARFLGGFLFLVAAMGFPLWPEVYWISINPSPRASWRVPVAFLDIKHYHQPELVSPRSMHFMHIPLSPVAYKERGGRNGMFKVYVAFAGFFKKSYVGQLAFSFEKNSSIGKTTLFKEDFVMSLYDAEGRATKENPAYLEIESETFGRARFSARDAEPGEFGRLIWWDPPDGERATLDTLDVERVFSRDGVPRQFRVKDLLLDVLDLPEGMEWHLYRMKDVSDTKNKEGIYEIHEGAVPVKSKIFHYPYPSSYFQMRVITRNHGRTKDVKNYRLHKVHKRRYSVYKTFFSPEKFPSLDPGGTIDENDKHSTAPVDWVERPAGAPEVGTRFERATRENYFDYLMGRSRGEDLFPAMITKYYDNPDHSGSFGREFFRVADGKFSQWRAVTYDDQGRIRTEHVSSPDSEGEPPPLEVEALALVSDRIELTYKNKTGDKIRKITHRRGDQFISRTWIRYAKDENGAEVVHLERTEKPEGKRGDAENFTETRYPEIIPGFELWK